MHAYINGKSILNRVAWRVDLIVSAHRNCLYKRRFHHRIADGPVFFIVCIFSISFPRISVHLRFYACLYKWKILAKSGGVESLLVGRARGKFIYKRRLHHRIADGQVFFSVFIFSISFPRISVGLRFYASLHKWKFHAKSRGVESPSARERTSKLHL